MTDFVNFAQEAKFATELDSAFFEENTEQHPGSVFGHPESFDQNRRKSKRFEGWYRTTSGRAATVILEAEDGEEAIGLLHFATGESEVRRSQSFRPCLFGPPDDTEDDFDSDVDEDDFESEVETDTGSEDESDEDSLPETLDFATELPSISQVEYRRNRGCSWYKMNSLGELFEQTNSNMETKTQKRMTMDAFGNFIVSGTEDQQDGYLKHIQMIQKRHPGVRNMKRSPGVSKQVLQLSESNLRE